MVWLKEPEQFRPILDEVCIPESDYLATIDEVLQVFPLSWAQKAASAIEREHSHIEWQLHPMPFNKLQYHPIPLIVTGQV